MSNQSYNPTSFNSLSTIDQRLSEIEAERSQLLLLKEQVRKKLLLKQTTSAQQIFSPDIAKNQSWLQNDHNSIKLGST